MPSSMADADEADHFQEPLRLGHVPHSSAAPARAQGDGFAGSLRSLHPQWVSNSTKSVLGGGGDETVQHAQHETAHDHVYLTPHHHTPHRDTTRSAKTLTCSAKTVSPTPASSRNPFNGMTIRESVSALSNAQVSGRVGPANGRAVQDSRRSTSFVAPHASSRHVHPAAIEQHDTSSRYPFIFLLISFQPNSVSNLQ